MRIKSLPYLVAVPIPTRYRTDERERRIPGRLRDRAVEKVMLKFGDWFGGATPIPWPCMGVWRTLGGSGLSIEKGQVVVTVMTTRALYRRNRRRIERLVAEIGRMLQQEAMAVLAMPASEGFLLYP